MISAKPNSDRGALVRRAFLELVAERGFHASMGAVAKRAGVAAGTIYVHHASKDDLVIAVYREVKRDLGVAAVSAVDPGAAPANRFRVVWRNVFQHLAADPVRARFLIQVDASPYADAAHEAVVRDGGDPLMAAAAAPEMVDLLVDLPPGHLYNLAFGPAIRLAAHVGRPSALDGKVTDRLIEACWRSITRP